MSLLQMSISAAILTMVITVVRALTLNRLPKKTFLVLWGVVLLRLFVPVSIPSPVSIYTLLNLRFADSTVTNEGNTAPVPVFEGGDLSYVPSRPGIPELPVIPWQSLLWAAGFTACSFFFIISYMRCRRRFAAAVPVSHKIVLTWQSSHPARRTIRVMESDLIAAPLTYGILHPVILLPKRTDWENERQLFYVLTHEYVHIRRLDSLIKLLLTAALCIHWFNPLVWVMVILANRDIEMSCDETVVHSFGETTKASYARVLIGMEEKKSTLIPLSNSFSKNAIEERITAIMKTKKTSLFAVMLAIVLVCGISAAFATSAAASEHTPKAVGGTAFTQDENETVSVSDERPEIRQEPYGTEADYESVRTLITADYGSMTVADFNASLLDWANENYDRSERIAVDAAMNDFNVTLTEEERYLITVTMRASNQENAALVKSLKTGKEKEDPSLGNFNLFKEDQNGTRNAWASLFYQLTYHITDEHKLTVSERDRALSGVFDDIATFFDETDVDTLLAMGEDGVMEVLQEILSAHSSDAIQISFPASGNGTQFEGMSEPNT